MRNPRNRQFFLDARHAIFGAHKGVNSGAHVAGARKWQRGHNCGGALRPDRHRLDLDGGRGGGSVGRGKRGHLGDRAGRTHLAAAAPNDHRKAGFHRRIRGNYRKRLTGGRCIHSRDGWLRPGGAPVLLFAVGTIGGLARAMFDSLLGASVQVIYW